MQQYIVGIIIGAVIFGGAGFYAGKQSASTPSRAQFANIQGRGGQQGARGNFAGFTTGEILSKDAQSVTIKMADGSTKIVLLSGSSMITRSASGTPEDLKVGTNVMIQGQANQDGSITAQSVQIRPAGSFGPRGDRSTTQQPQQ